MTFNLVIEAKQHFSEHDASKDGHLDAKEYEQAHEMTGWMTHPPHHAEHPDL